LKYHKNLNDKTRYGNNLDKTRYGKTTTASPVTASKILLNPTHPNSKKTRYGNNLDKTRYGNTDNKVSF
jgi:hypothetical protein